MSLVFGDKGKDQRELMISVRKGDPNCETVDALVSPVMGTIGYGNDVVPIPVEQVAHEMRDLPLN